MVSHEIVFPIMDLSDWIFDDEKVLDIDFSWVSPNRIKESDYEKHVQSLIVDSKGQVLKVKGNILQRNKSFLFSFIFPPTLMVEFDLDISNRKMSLEEVKRKILSRSSENFNITDNKLMTLSEYNAEIKAASTYEELFRIAAFEDEE